MKSEPFLEPLSRAHATGSASLTTVLIAFAANLLVAVAKSVAAVVTGSASILAEAAHSWADTGNEVFLVKHLDKLKANAAASKATVKRRVLPFGSPKARKARKA